MSTLATASPYLAASVSAGLMGPVLNLGLLGTMGIYLGLLSIIWAIRIK
jgi:hypothetical protein